MHPTEDEHRLEIEPGGNHVSIGKKSIVFFHGSSTVINSFSMEYTGKGHDAFGSGIYFTTCSDEAHTYTSRGKKNDTNRPNITPVLLSFKNPIFVDGDKNDGRYTTSTKPMNMSKIRRLLYLSPNFEESLSNFGELGYEKLERIVERAAKNYFGYTDIIMQLNAISTDFYSGAEKDFLEHLYPVMGYDGVLIKKNDISYHAVVWETKSILSIFEANAPRQNMSMIKSDKSYAEEDPVLFANTNDEHSSGHHTALRISG